MNSIGISNDYNQMTVPLTAREPRERVITKWHDGTRKHSIDGRNSRTNNLTTAPITSHRNTMMQGTPTDLDESMLSHTFGAGGIDNKLKPNFFNLDITNMDVPQTAIAGGKSIFTSKRNTVQPKAGTKMQVMDRSIINANDPFRMNTYARQHMKKAGCQKEQQKQYMNYVNEATKTNQALRDKIQGQPRSSTVKKVDEQSHAPLVAILPVSDLNLALGGRQYGRVGSTDKKSNLDSAYLTNTKNSSQKKTLPPIQDGNSKQEIRVKRTSEIQLTGR